MAAVRLTKMMRLNILESFKRQVHEQVAANSGEQTLKELEAVAFMAIRDRLIGRHKDAFNAIPMSADILPKTSYINLNFNEPPLAHLRPENLKGGHASIYRKTWFTIHNPEEVTVPVSMSGRCLSYDDLPGSVQSKVLKAVIQAGKYESEMDNLISTFTAMLNECSTIKTLKEKWPGVEKYLPEGIDAPCKALGVTAAQIEAQLNRVLKAAA